jgi:hypothetical protein
MREAPRVGNGGPQLIHCRAEAGRCASMGRHPGRTRSSAQSGSWKRRAWVGKYDALAPYGVLCSGRWAPQSVRREGAEDIMGKLGRSSCKSKVGNKLHRETTGSLTTSISMMLCQTYVMSNTKRSTPSEDSGSCFHVTVMLSSLEANTRKG